MKENAMQPLKASELIKILEQRIEENGDLEISVNTQDGGAYSLYDESDVVCIEWTRPDGTISKTLDIW